MKKEDVPQDASNLSSINMRELLYATDENGKYTTARSSGWEPKTIALVNSIEDINERIENARMQVKNGSKSPIFYFMELNKMQIAVLSGYVGMASWRIRRHFKPAVFARLSDDTLKKYADTFSISVAELRTFTTD